MTSFKVSLTEWLQKRYTNCSHCSNNVMNSEMTVPLCILPVLSLRERSVTAKKKITTTKRNTSPMKKERCSRTCISDKCASGASFFLVSVPVATKWSS